MAVLWNVAPCDLADTDRRSTEAKCNQRILKDMDVTESNFNLCVCVCVAWTHSVKLQTMHSRSVGRPRATKFIFMNIESCLSLWHSEYRPDDGDSKLVWNIGQYLLDFTAQFLRRAIFIQFTYLRSKINLNFPCLSYVHNIKFIKEKIFKSEPDKRGPPLASRLYLLIKCISRYPLRLDVVWSICRRKAWHAVLCRDHK